MNENFRENIKPFVFIIIVLILTAITAHSQRKFPGVVTEVLDGKTCVVQLQTNRVTVVLQYIETPEPEQPLHSTVKAHLENLVLGKQIEFLPRIVMRDRTVGQLVVKGVDVSQQMLRDGAAWHALPEKSGQDETQRQTYEENESQARTEKRGVWSVENLKPSWEYRAEAEEKRRREEQLAAEQAKNNAFVEEMQRQKKSSTPQKKQLSSESSMWAVDEQTPLPKEVMNIGGLWVANEPNGRFGFIATPLQKFEYTGKNTSKIGIGLAYIYFNDPVLGQKQIYILGIESETEKFVFLNNNNLTLTLGKQKINLGKARRNAGAKDLGVRETLIYVIKRDVLEKIANAENISVKVGNFQGKVDAQAQMILKNMMNALP